MLPVWGAAGWAVNFPVMHVPITLAPSGAGQLLSLNAAIDLGAGLRCRRLPAPRYWDA